MVTTTQKPPLNDAVPAPETESRAGGVLLLVGAATMFAGAGVFLSVGADLDVALTTGDLGEYLTDAASNPGALRLNIALWIIGVVMIGMGGNVLARGQGVASSIARFCYTAGPAAALVFFPVWMAIVLEIVPAHAAGENVLVLAAALGQAATIADWIATVLIVGVGPVALARSNPAQWIPSWLKTWSHVAFTAGALAIVALVFFDRSPVMNLAIVIGLSFHVVAGFHAIRRGV